MTWEVMGGVARWPTVSSVTMTMDTPEQPVQVGKLLRSWRERRRLSQLDLSLQADVSTRHLSYVETGRSRPTSSMILHLSDRLEIPLRDRNALLLAGGYAPAFPESRSGRSADGGRQRRHQFRPRRAIRPIRRSWSTGIGRWWRATTPSHC